MKNLMAVASVSLLMLSSNVWSAPARALHVKESIEINASASTVWSKVSNFGDLGAWHPAVAKTEIVAGKNNEKGAERLLTLQDGGTIKERLLAYDAKKLKMRYEILEGVLPVTHYASDIVVKASGKNKATVTWSSTFMRKDMGEMPVAGQDDEAAVKTITGVYKGGLENLKKISE